MTNYISARLGILGDEALPSCRLNGSSAYIEFEQDSATFEISLANHPDPGDYLRRLAHQLTALAHDVDAARDQHEPSGYDAPIPYVLKGALPSEATS